MPAQIIIFFLIGVIAGFMSGMFGIGGGLKGTVSLFRRKYDEKKDSVRCRWFTKVS